MAQDPSKWRQACRKCNAERGKPCIVVIPSSYGRTRVADKVHYGRGNYFERRPRRAYVPRPAYVPTPGRSALFAEAHAEVEARRFKD